MDLNIANNSVSVERLLNETRVKVCVYTGQLDLIVDTPGTYAWVDRLKWPGRSAWDAAPRQPLVGVDVPTGRATHYVEGYYKKSGLFSMYWVDRAGHMVPADNPPAMYAILEQLMAKA